ncbi:MAG: glycosyltransferase family 4 protein [Alphaproteobacteria bacterium]|nr:glycosyltransferase family 4 protein [Alphaproteobacteria bacterium]MBV9372530.1 glycosyltransferase family 4 protein [Alphaproteobacteria bacterium]MBV9902241.1 glycosyltransferase family 4 protein [Alphaproteobacteria bacterium]
MDNEDGKVPGKRFAFISSNFTWGGSEILWSEAAATLARRGHKVWIYKNRLNPAEGNVARLRELGVKRIELAHFPFLPNKLYSFVAMFTPYLSVVYQAMRLHVALRLRGKVDLVVISQGGNHDGWLLASVCRRMKVPYVLICQKATDLYWPQDKWLPAVRAIYEEALHAFFVSAHNLRLTEEQIGRRLPRASVVRNPFLVPWDAAPAWPDEEEGIAFACVGRLYPKEKGQDIVLRVLASEKWRARPVRVTFYGAGEQREGLEAMAAYHGLSNVAFAGYEDDVQAIWARHHALLLPSRAEGLPLVLVEAMLCGRVAVVTDVAGNAEVVDDGATGFVADAAAERSFDEAMERAWQRRREWREIGAEAARRIRTLVPSDPPAALCETLLRLAGEASPRRG